MPKDEPFVLDNHKEKRKSLLESMLPGEGSQT